LAAFIFGTLLFIVLYTVLFTPGGPGMNINKDTPVFVELTGYSMQPTIENGERRECVQEQEYFIGDVVTFNIRNQLVSHRIIGKLFDKFITKGDNNIIPDLSLVAEADIICKVI
jgi:signal peptidase I